jgi:hypothetical protein
MRRQAQRKVGQGDVRKVGVIVGAAQQDVGVERRAA